MSAWPWSTVRPTSPPPTGDDPGDPYAGTGLIRELLELGPGLLNPDNPAACLYLQASSLAARDVARYPCHGRLEAVGPPLEVPLKILKVQTARDWTRFLVEEHGLVRSEARLRETGFEFWHTLSVLRLTRS